MVWGNTICPWCVPSMKDSKIKLTGAKVSSFLATVFLTMGLAFVAYILVFLFYASFTLIYVLNKSSPSYASDSAQVLSAIATVLLTVVTIATLMANNSTTKENLRLTKLMAESLTEPLIAVEIAPAERPDLLKMIITNVGNGVARDVNFSNVPDFQIFENKKLNNIDFIKRGIRYFPPGQSFSTLVTDLDCCQKLNKTTVLQFTISYKNAAGKDYTEPVTLDFATSLGVIYHFDNRDGMVMYKGDEES